jgi:hypothetical protein
MSCCAFWPRRDDIRGFTGPLRFTGPFGFAGPLGSTGPLRFTGPFGFAGPLGFTGPFKFTVLGFTGRIVPLDMTGGGILGAQHPGLLAVSVGRLPSGAPSLTDAPVGRVLRCGCHTLQQIET